jgi:hypothetical protein
MPTAPCSPPEPSAAISRRDTLRKGARLLLAAGIVLPLGLPAAAQKSDKKAKDPQPVTDTLIKVTTFSEIGATLRGASVKLLPADKDGNPVKGKAQQGVTNNMGEYPFRVPKTEATYVLRAEAKGFVTTDKVVTARGEDQLDIFLQLPARK